MADIVRGVLEDSRKGIMLNGFDGGIVTDTGGLSLGPNQSPDALNVFAWEGNLHFRGGFRQFSALSAAADGAFTYYDVNQNAHMVEWANGSMYEVTTGTSVLIRAGCYTPGETIAHAQINGVMYWSTLSVPLRQWDGTTEQAVVNAGGTGTVPPPACMFLVAFNGALVAVNFVSGGIHFAGSFIWSDVNNPNKWVGANVQTVGSNDGGVCVFAIVMGVAQVGVSPVKQFMVGKNNRQLFLYSGALSPGTLIEQAVSSPVGIQDGQTAIYIPTQQGLGAVMFLGDDGQFYLCNGIECTMASQNIKLLCSNLIDQALTINPGQRFNAVYNQRFLYYMCDYGNDIQLVYKWDTAAWWLFRGWPSGVYTTAPSNHGLPSVFVSAQGVGTTAGVYELALDQTDDNGSDIQAYYTTPYIHGGKPERLKLFQEVTMFSYNVGVQYKVTGYGLPQSNGAVPTTRALYLNDPAVGATPIGGGSAVWGVATWGVSTWSGGQAPSLTQPYQIGGMKGPLTVLSAATKWAAAGTPVPLRSGGAQFKIEWYAGVPDFRVTSFKIALLFQNENVGILPFSNYGQVVTNVVNGIVKPGDKFMNRGQKLPLNLPGPSRHPLFAGLTGPVAYGIAPLIPVTLYGWDSKGNVEFADFDIPALTGLDNSLTTDQFGLQIDESHNAAFMLAQVQEATTFNLGVEDYAMNGNLLPGGPFRSPGGVYTIGPSCIGVKSQALSHSRQYLYSIVENTAGTGTFVRKIRISDGALVATSATVAKVAGANRLDSCLITADDSKIIACTWRGDGLNNCTVYAFRATDLATLGTAVIAAPYSPIDYAISADGSKFAVYCAPIPAGPPTAMRVFIFNTASYALSNFAAGNTVVNSGVSSAISFVGNNSSRVLCSIDATVKLFTTAGALISTFSNVIANGSGTRVIGYMGAAPGTPLLFGTSTENPGSGPYTVWSYDVSHAKQLSEQSTTYAVVETIFDTH